MDLSAYQVTGSNNSAKQVSVDRWNNLLAAIEAGGGSFAVVDDYPSIDPTGVADSTAGLIALLGDNRNVYIKPGTYRIAGAGPDAGGAYVTLTNSLSVFCADGARFVGDGVDNDMFRFTVPSNGNGVPADGIAFDWVGGIFDQRSQKVSTSVPYSAEYPAPAGLQGVSATTSGISLMFSYVSGGVAKYGARNVRVAGATFIAGDHWQAAGGDSAIYIGDGTATSLVENCIFVGSRDVAIYGSRDSTGVVGRNLTVRGCDFRSCFYGVSAKRGLSRFQVTGNVFDNCVSGAVTNLVTGVNIETEGVEISGNSFNACSVSVRLDYSRSAYVGGNTIRNIGALLANGTAFPNISAFGFTLSACTYTTVEGNTFEGVSAGFTASNIHAIALQNYTVNGVAVGTTYAKISRNAVAGLRSIGVESGAANDNTFDFNQHSGTTLTGPVIIGSRSVQHRAYDTTTSGSRYYIGSTEVWRASSASFRLLVPIDLPVLPTATNDTEAAAAGVAVRGLYRNGNIVMVRVA